MVTWCRNACIFVQAYGVPLHDLFQTVDLYEDKNMVQVILAIHALGGRAQKNRFDGPVIGVKHADANKCVQRMGNGCENLKSAK